MCPRSPGDHPFIKFQLDLNRLGHEDWILLGEAASKVAHLIGIPLQPEVARQFLRLWLVKGVQATTAIEGNTLSEAEIEAIINRELKLPPSKRYLQQEVENILGACNELLESFQAGRPPALDADWIRAANAKVLAGLDLDQDVVPGRWREHSVGVGRYRAPQASQVPRLMERLASWLAELGKDLEGASRPLSRPVRIVRAIVAHLYMAWIHPFGDGNGRTARLLEHAILLEAGVPAVSAHLLSNHYNQTRTAYYRQLDAAGGRGEPYTFIRYSLQGLVDGLREQIQQVQAQQERVTWTNFIYETMDPKTAAQKRRARVALALGDEFPAGRPARALRTLNPELAEAYAGTTSKTLTRDLNALSSLKLVVCRKGLWLANIELIRAFRPFSADAQPWVG